MGKPKLDRTYSTFSDNPGIGKSPIQESAGRAGEVRRDNDTS